MEATRRAKSGSARNQVDALLGTGRLHQPFDGIVGVRAAVRLGEDKVPQACRTMDLVSELLGAD